MPGFLQSDLLTRLSTHGFAVVAPWTLASDPEEEYTGDGVREVLGWAEDNLVQLLVDSGEEREEASISLAVAAL